MEVQGRTMACCAFLGSSLWSSYRELLCKIYALHAASLPVSYIDSGKCISSVCEIQPNEDRRSEFICHKVNSSAIACKNSAICPTNDCTSRDDVSGAGLVECV